MQELCKFGQEAKEVELSRPRQYFSLSFLHLSYLHLLHLLPEAHEHEEREHGELEARADPDAAGGPRHGGELAEE